MVRKTGRKLPRFGERQKSGGLHSPLLITVHSDHRARFVKFWPGRELSWDLRNNVRLI